MCIAHGTQWGFFKNFENNFFRSCGNKKNNVKQKRQIYTEIEKNEIHNLLVDEN